MISFNSCIVLVFFAKFDFAIFCQIFTVISFMEEFLNLLWLVEVNLDLRTLIYNVCQRHLSMIGHELNLACSLIIQKPRTGGQGKFLPLVAINQALSKRKRSRPKMPIFCPKCQFGAKCGLFWDKNLNYFGRKQKLRNHRTKVRKKPPTHHVRILFWSSIRSKGPKKAHI